MSADRETEFTHASTDYVAVAVEDGGINCDGCAFNMFSCDGLGLPSCDQQTRQDKINVIFVKK